MPSVEVVEAALALLERDLSEARLRDALAVGLPVRLPAGRSRGSQLRLRMESVGARLVGLPPDTLPERLRVMGDANPAPLFLTDAPSDSFDGAAVAVVGTRRATGAGLDIAFNLGVYLAEAGVVVVSGLARGIDGAVHRGVVAAGGRGLAILGSGIDRVYPARHASLATSLRDLGGGLVSHYAPGAEPLPWRFPRRNRLIAALSDAVVVVEAHSSGGALITAREALDLGRDVMAVPGSPLVPAAAGTNLLLADGAAVVHDFAVVVEALGLASPRETRLWADGAPDPVSADILDLLTSDPVSIDRLVRVARRDATTVSKAVARLELAGLAVRERGGVRRAAR